MGCYEDHMLLAYLDGELKSEGMAVESHLKQCSDCQERLRVLAEDEQFLEGVLSEHLEEIDLSNAFKEESWIRLKLQLNADHKQKPGRSLPGKSRSKSGVAAAAAILLLAGTLFFGGARSAVADFLSVFRVDRIETIEIITHEMAQIDTAIRNGLKEIDIDNIGTFKIVGSEEILPECTLDEAAEIVGFKIMQLDIDGYVTPRVSVKKQAQMSLTLNVPGINSMIYSLGGTRLLPRELDQQTITLSAPPRVFLNYRSAGLPPVSIVQMRSPELAVPGNIEVEEVKDALLSLPFWPEKIRQQLASIDDWRHTMVIPTTANLQPVTVRGHQGVIWNNEPEHSMDSTSTTVLWSENGIIYSINGQLPLEQILEMAEGMK